VEKPLTLAPEESRQLAELADQLGRILQVGHIFRFDPAARWLREAVREGNSGGSIYCAGILAGSNGRAMTAG